MKNTPGIFVIAAVIISVTFSCKKKNDNPADGVYRFEEKITIDGRERTYLLNLPTSYYTGADFSLIIAMHGGGGEAKQLESSSKLTEKANASGFIVVYPEGLKSNGILQARTWNAGSCCDYARDNNINDVKFISSLIDKLVSTYKINPKKVYATGHSNGGMMSYRLACELSNKIAAIAPNGSTMVVTSPCNASRAVPILHMHSMLDTNVPYKGGIGTGVSFTYFPPLDSVFNVWSAKNACATTAQIITNNSGYTFTKWSNCSSNTTIEYYLTKDGGHAWPGGTPGSATGDKPSTAINANDLLWEFFQKHQLP